MELAEEVRCALLLLAAVLLGCPPGYEDGCAAGAELCEGDCELVMDASASAYNRGYFNGFFECCGDAC